MPCVALNQRKIQLAYRAHRRQRKTSNSRSVDAAKAADKSITPQPQSSAVRLKDGDHVQIRSHRTRPTTLPKSSPSSALCAKNQTSTRSTHKAAKKHAKIRTKIRVKPKRRPLAPRRPSRAELIDAESRLGSTIFGPVADGHQRKFFHDRENIWIWHESWLDAKHQSRQLTVRYEVRPSGVYKKISVGKYFKLEGAELENFRKATRAYLSLIKQHLYRTA